LLVTALPALVITEWEMHITAQGPRLQNDLYCVEWDVKLYHTIPYHIVPYRTIPYCNIPYHTIDCFAIYIHTCEKFPPLLWHWSLHYFGFCLTGQTPNQLSQSSAGITCSAKACCQSCFVYMKQRMFVEEIQKWTSLTVRHVNSLSLHFNSHFPGEPGLASVYWS